MPREVWTAGAVVAVLVAAAYVTTAAHDIIFGDTPELVGTAVALGIAHPPGYPIWTVIAHLFTLLPLDTIPFRVSLFSAACGAATAVLVHLTAYRLSRSVIASATVAVVFALVPTVWSWSVVPEVFALADALAAALLYLLLVWHDTGDERAFVGAAFVGGLGLAHQQTIALLAPGVLYLMWHHRRRFREIGLFVRATVAATAGLLPYVYLPIRAAAHPAWDWGEISSVSDVLGHVLRFDYGTGSLVSVERFQGGAIADRLLALVQSLSVPEAILAIAGLVLLYQRDRAWFWSTAVAAFVAGPLFITYSNTNVSLGFLHAVLERFCLLPQVVLAPVGAIALAASTRTIHTGSAEAPARIAKLGACAVALAFAGAVAYWQLGYIDQSQSHVARSFGTDILTSVRPNVVLLTSGDAVIGPVEYLRTVERTRPDISIVEMPLLPGAWYIRQLHREHPDLHIPFASLDGVTGTMRALVDANGADRFDIAGSLADSSLASSYALYRRGLIEELHKKPTEVDPDAYASLNDQALRGYHIPTVDSVRAHAWDRLILADYGLIAYDVGYAYNGVKRTAEARQWFRRALAIDPDLSEARSALASLPP